MDAHKYPPPDLIELHELFMKLRLASSAVRREMIQEVILHPAMQLRLTEAYCVVLKHRAAYADVRDEVMQGAILVLIERLTADKLAYRNDGADRFGGWLYTICHSACADSWKRCRPLALQSIALVDSTALAQIAVPPQEESKWDQLVEAIDRLADHALRDVMLEWVAGATIRETASRRGISVGSIYNLRQRAASIIREQEVGL